MNTDPVFQAKAKDVTPGGLIEGKWYFYNEVWSDTYGPYDTESICRESLEKYCEANL